MSEALVPELILASCRRHEREAAVSAGGQELSYGALLARAHGVAASLLGAGVRGRPVLLLSEKKPSTYAALLGIWLSGNHFLPVPRACPEERLRKIAAEAAPAFALGSRAGFPKALPLPDSRWLDPDQVAPLASAPELPALTADTLAYLAYTSGSSGKPKGCGISHANLLAWHEGTRGHYHFSPRDRISQVFELTFDPSVSDILWAFLNGATLWPLHFLELAALDRYFERERITVWSSSPSLARMALEGGRLAPGAFLQLRLSTFIGEKLTPGLAAAWRALAPGSALENLYGPAEATISVCRFRLEAGAEAPAGLPSVPIGLAYESAELLLADPCGQEAAEGELWIGGPQVSGGYLDPAEGSERFVEKNFPGRRSPRWYRSGDLARRLASGELLFLGRLDHQLKIQGQRFEPGEAEALARSEGLEGAFALPWPSADEAEGLVLAVTRDPGPATLERFLTACERSLPGFAVPSAVFLVPEVPLNANGKTDRAALLALLPSRERIYPR